MERPLTQVGFCVQQHCQQVNWVQSLFLMFGRNSKLPIDQMFGLDSVEVSVDRKSHAQFVQDWKHSMTTAYETANKNIENLYISNSINVLGETHDNSEELDTEIGICCMCREHSVFYYDSSPIIKNKEKE